MGLRSLELSGGLVSATGTAIHLEIPPIQVGYTDAQVDDYQRLPRRSFLWRPPLRLSLTARASPSHPTGTLGFGFWNDPFTFSLGQGGAARRLPASPQALWFFYGSPPNDMSFVPGSPPHGWKASSLRSARIPPALLAPAAGAAALLAQIKLTRGPVMRLALRMVTAAEEQLQIPLDTWHRYTLVWTEKEARFAVDDGEVLVAPAPPRGPLGFVAWIDNQFAVASSEGGLRFGTLPTSASQWLEIDDFRIESKSV
jgi:hypothetical protein